MSFESDMNQLKLYQKIRDDFVDKLKMKYAGRTVTVMESPYRQPASFFKLGESYTIDGFSTYNNEPYIINRSDGTNRPMAASHVSLNPLDMGSEN